jgi:hypothetical protein
MTGENNSISGHSDIHCPYCWAEINGIEEKYGKYFVYQSSISEKVIVLPVENPKDYFNLVWFGGINSVISSIKGNQNIQKGEICPICKRKFTLLVFPYEYNLQKKLNFENFLKKFDCFYDHPKPKSLSEQIPLIFGWKSDWFTFLFSLWLILIFNAFLILFISYFILYDFQTTKQFIIDFFSLVIIQAILVVIMKKHSNLVNQFEKTEELPYLIHQNYLNTPDFQIFRNLIHRGLNFARSSQKFGVVLICLSMIYPISKFGGFQILSLFYSNDIALWFNTSILVFFLVFFIIAILVTYFVLMSTITLIIFTRSIPLKILPLADSYGIKLYENFLFYSLVLSVIISIIIPLCFNILPINSALTEISSSTTKYATLLSTIQNGNILSVILIVILVFTVPIILLKVTSNNISSRKSEHLNEIRDKISVSQKLTNPSIKDLLLISVLLTEYEKIESMSKYPFNKLLLLFAGGLIYFTPILIGLIFA